MEVRKYQFVKTRILYRSGLVVRDIDTYTGIAVCIVTILIQIPGIFTNNLQEFGISIGTIPILDLIPIPGKDSLPIPLLLKYPKDTFP